MAKRKTMRPSTRFEVFKRDKFTCQYCGRSAPAVVLRVDHLHPVSKGGEDDLLNLVTACFDCNAGKGATLLFDDSALTKQRAQLEELQERREQLEMMVQWKTGLMSLDDEAVKHVEDYFAGQAGWALTPTSRAHLKKLIAKYGIAEVLEAFSISLTKHSERDQNGKASAQVAGEAWAYVSRVLSVREAERKSPGTADLFYTRGIARKRCGYFNDWKALAALKACAALGASSDEMRDIAKSCRNWTDWSSLMDDLAARLTEARGAA